MRNGVAALPWVRTLTIESFLQLVTSIKYASDSKLETLVVTSPSQGDGKSTISVNVALAMAELEPRVLLIDADLRRASIHTKLHMKNERGLSDVLVGPRAADRSRAEDQVSGTGYSDQRNADSEPYQICSNRSAWTTCCAKPRSITAA